VTSTDISLRGIWSELKPAVAERRKSTVAALCALAFLGLSQALSLVLIKGFVKALIGSSERQTYGLQELLPPDFLRVVRVSPDYQVARSDLAVFVPVAIIGAGLMMSAALYYYQYHQQVVSMYVAKFLRERLFARILSFRYGRIVQRSPGVWMSVIMNDIMFLQNRLSDLLTALFKDMVIVFSCFAFLIFAHPPTALVLAVLAPVIALGMGRTGKRIARFAEKFQSELAKIASIVLNIRERFEFVRAQHGEKRELAWFRASNDAYYRMIRKSILIRSAFAPVMELVGFLLFAALVWAVGRGYWLTLTPELMLQFFGAVGLMLRPLREIGEQLSRLQESRGAMAECLALLREHVEAESVSVAVSAGGTASLSLKNIAAGYDGKTVFSASDLVLRPGRSVAIVGASGSGKSTLIKTLAGLIRPVTWDGNVSWSEFAAMTSLVSQDPFLFDDTVRANLIYGTEGETPSDQDILAGLRLVKLAEGNTSAVNLDGHFRALGTNLSGGQIQRLVIVRALLRRKKFILLDEATSAVDAMTEEEITRALTSRCAGGDIGLVAVTHRLEWLSLYDEIWFVESGRITAAGSLDQMRGHAGFSTFLARGPGD
jgi:subfamily B ATP-binding cassette protein MsbA